MMIRPGASAQTSDLSSDEISVPSSLSISDTDAADNEGGVKKFLEHTWKNIKFEKLPAWMQDNEYLRSGHRPQLPSLWLCLKSISAVHSETGNIWTHLFGCIAFLGMGIYFICRPNDDVNAIDRIIFSAFFIGAVTCLGMSAAFHILLPHSPQISGLFSKLDYTGIALLIVGSFIPWLHYAFCCRPQPRIIYITMITVLGIAALVVSLFDKFAQPKFRALRALVFCSMGLSAVVPALHVLIADGWTYFTQEGNLYGLLIMGALYLVGAALYALRIPERFFPGLCDIWFQSHQIFHVLVLLAAFVHYTFILATTRKKLENGSCAEQLLNRYGVESNPSLLGKWLGLDEEPGIVSWSPDDIL